MKRLRQGRPQGEHPEGYKRLAAYPMRVLAPLLLVAALVTIALAGYWLKRPAGAINVDCADPLSGCAFSHRGAPANVYFSEQPVPMEVFELRVGTPDAIRISAEFQMTGMDMGFNRYDLRTGEEGTFSSKVTLPVCVSGRRDWTLYLDIDGTRYALPFSTR